MSLSSLSLLSRGVNSTFSDAKTTLSSWDNCMSKAYCKWPVIVAIIVASLLVLLLVVSLFRCLCCGVECCCGCLACCNACCPSPRRRGRTKYIEAPQQPNLPHNPYTYQTQWQPQPQRDMSTGGFNGAPQFATFDAPSRSPVAVNEDALPAMPSWSTAQSRRVEDSAYQGAEPDGGAGREQGDFVMEGQRQPMLPSVSPVSMELHQYQDPSATGGGRLGRPHQQHYPSYVVNPNYQTGYTNNYQDMQGPPSYHTRAPPSPSPYHTADFPLTQALSYQPAPSADLFYPSPTAQTQQQQSGRVYQPPNSSLEWGAPGGVQRKPVQGSWREV